MGNESSMHVGNCSGKTLRARVAQTETNIKEIEMSVGIKKPLSLDASMKAILDHHLDVIGFARIGPKDALAFDLPKGNKQPVYVSVTTADDPTPLVVCFNYPPPRDRSVIISKNLTVTLSQKHISPDKPFCPNPADCRRANDPSDESKGGEMSLKSNRGNAETEKGESEEDGWMTDDGMFYTSDMAIKVHHMSEVEPVTNT